MERKLTILKKAPYYKYPVLSSSEMGIFEKDQYLSFTREKRRNGVNWYGVILTDGKEVYVEKRRLLDGKKEK